MPFMTSGQETEWVLFLQPRSPHRDQSKEDHPRVYIQLHSYDLDLDPVTLILDSRDRSDTFIEMNGQ